jgi:UDPglucose 6-dehydrogenase
MARTIVVGSGVVGTATGKAFARHGHQVFFFDINPARVEALRAEGYAAGTELDLSGPPAYIFLTLPTPNDGRRFDMRMFDAGTATVGRALKLAGSMHTVVVRSTVVPGTCEGRVRPILERESGKKAHVDFGLASNPEFLRAACALEDVLHPWMTVVASKSKRTAERLTEFYRPYGGELRVFSDPAQAEMVKCAHNLFNATKISFWNEMWLVARKIGVRDMDTIADVVSKSAEGSWSREYGTKPGMPYGGVCLPKDTQGFYGFAAENGVDMPLLDGVIRVNDLTAEAAMEFDPAAVQEILDSAKPTFIDLTSSTAPVTVHANGVTAAHLPVVPGAENI